jgi:hypothetical protein
MPLPDIIYNQGDDSVLKLFEQLLPITQRSDVASGYFEIGSLLDLDGKWQALEGMRVLMGDEVTRRTRAEVVKSLLAQSDASIEAAKEKDDALTGLSAVRQALTAGQIKARVFGKDKFHAKGYLMEFAEGRSEPKRPVGRSSRAHDRKARTLAGVSAWREAGVSASFSSHQQKRSIVWRRSPMVRRLQPWD